MAEAYDGPQGLDAFLAAVASGTSSKDAAEQVIAARKKFKDLIPEKDAACLQFKLPSVGSSENPQAVGSKAVSVVAAIPVCSGTESGTLSYLDWLDLILRVPPEKEQKFSKHQYLQFMAQRSTGHLHTAIQSILRRSDFDFEEALKDLALTFSQASTPEEATKAYANFMPSEAESFPLMAVRLEPIARSMAMLKPKPQREDEIKHLIINKLQHLASLYGSPCLTKINKKVAETQLELRVSSVPPAVYARICQEISREFPAPNFHRIQDLSEDAGASLESLRDHLPNDSFYRISGPAQTRKKQRPVMELSNDSGYHEPVDRPMSEGVYRASAPAPNQNRKKPPPAPQFKSHDWRLPVEKEHEAGKFCQFYGPHCIGYRKKTCTKRHELCPVCQLGKKEWQDLRGHERDAKRAGIDPQLCCMDSPALAIPSSQEELVAFMQDQKDDPMDDFADAVLDFFQETNFLVPGALFLDED